MWEMMMFCWNWIIAHHMALAPTAEAQGISKWGGLSAAPYARMHWALGTLISITLQLPWNFQQDYSLQIAGLLSYCLDSHLNSFFPPLNPSLIELQHSEIEHTDPAWSQCWPWVNQTSWSRRHDQMVLIWKLPQHSWGWGWEGSEYSTGHPFQGITWHG